MYYGATYEDIKDIYYDICMLDVLSGVEIDKAKKEFDVNSVKELNKIKDKYSDMLSDEYNKMKLPHFFSHISKQKGYYNPQKKNYCKYNTSMDYLQTIVNGFRVTTPYNKIWLPFVAILDNNLFRTNSVNQKQINKIFSILKKYISEKKKIFGSDLCEENKFEQSQILYKNLISEINNEIIGFSTLFRLLSSIEVKDNSQIKNILLQVLYLCGNEGFNKAIIHSAKEITQLSDSGTDIFLYGIGYKIESKVIANK